MSLETHINAINETKTVEDAFNKFHGIVAEYGYARVVYSLITDHPSLGLKKQSGLISSYPDDWIQFYGEKNYFDRDPVVHGVYTQRTPFYWKDLKKDAKIANEDLNILDQGEEAGLKNGIGIPLYGLGGEIVGLGLARDVNDNDQNYETMAQLYLLANIFHQKYRTLLTKPIVDSITQKEKDILAWAAESKTDDEIGFLIGISVNTVRYHWKNIFRKLEAYGRYVAISKAITMGIIEPRFVIPPLP